MRKERLAQKMGRLIFPLILYGFLAMLYPELLGLVSGGWLLEPEASMWLLTAGNLFMLPIFCLLYHRDRGQQEVITRQSFSFKAFLLLILGSVCISRGINYFLALTFLPHYFPGYERVSEEIYRCSLLSQIMAGVISAPFLEEVLMRGIIYGRLREMIERTQGAMVGSALIFGLFHGNVVQGVYAFVMGLFFAQVYEKYHSLFPAVFAHMIANGASVLAGRIAVPVKLLRAPGFYELLTAALLLVGMYCWRYFCRNEERS